MQSPAHSLSLPHSSLKAQILTSGGAACPTSCPTHAADALRSGNAAHAVQFAQTCPGAATAAPVEPLRAPTQPTFTLASLSSYPVAAPRLAASLGGMRAQSTAPVAPAQSHLLPSNPPTASLGSLAVPDVEDEDATIMAFVCSSRSSTLPLQAEATPSLACCGCPTMFSTPNQTYSPFSVGNPTMQPLALLLSSPTAPVVKPAQALPAAGDSNPGESLPAPCQPMLHLATANAVGDAHQSGPPEALQTSQMLMLLLPTLHDPAAILAADDNAPGAENEPAKTVYITTLPNAVADAVHPADHVAADEIMQAKPVDSVAEESDIAIMEAFLASLIDTSSAIDAAAAASFHGVLDAAPADSLDAATQAANAANNEYAADHPSANSPANKTTATPHASLFSASGSVSPSHASSFATPAADTQPIMAEGLQIIEAFLVSHSATSKQADMDQPNPDLSSTGDAGQAMTSKPHAPAATLTPNATRLSQCCGDSLTPFRQPSKVDALNLVTQLFAGLLLATNPAATNIDATSSISKAAKATAIPLGVSIKVAKVTDATQTGDAVYSATNAAPQAHLIFDPGGGTFPCNEAELHPYYTTTSWALLIPFLDKVQQAVCLSNLITVIYIYLYQVTSFYNPIYGQGTFSSTTTHIPTVEFMFSLRLRGRMCCVQAPEITHALDVTKSFKVRSKQRSELLIFYMVKSTMDPG